MSGDSQQGDEEPDGEGEDEINGENEADTDSAFPTPRPPPQGVRHELGVTLDSRLIVYARSELFEFEEREVDWWFRYLGGGGAALEISYIMITALGVEEHAKMVLNDYTGDSDAEFTGEESIAGSELRGYHATARLDAEIFEAWVHTLDGSDLALVFVINYENDQQRDALFEVLSTLDMITAGDFDMGIIDQDIVHDDDDYDPESGDE